MLVAWANGRRDDHPPAEVRRVSLEYPGMVVRAAAWRAGVMAVPTAALAYGFESDDLNPQLATLAVLASWFLLLYGVAVAYHLQDLTLRPLRTEIGGAMEPAEFAATRSLSITTKLLMGLAAASLVLGFLVASIVLPSGSSASGASRAIAITVVLVLTVGSSLAFPLARSSLAPIGDLIAGTDAVRTGDLEAVVPVTSTDELGELATRFNEMVEGLRERDLLRGRNVELVDELRASRARIVAASHKARRRVERDLHDGAQQNLMLVNLKLGLAERAAKRDPEIRALVEDARADLDRALDELRDLAHGIYPAVLTSDGLGAALAEAVQQAPMKARLECAGHVRYEPELEAAVYFCCQEALQNTAKHAGTEAQAAVSLSDVNGELRFEVSDDGPGFEARAARSSAGLQNMRDRIGALGGELRIESAPGRGTTVAGSVPLAG
jgi:signal transduction histidine kinase